MVTVQFNFKTIIEAQEFLAGYMNKPAGAGYPLAPEFSVPAPQAVVLNPEAVVLKPKTTVTVTAGEDEFAGMPVDADGFIQTTAEPKAEKKKRGPKPKTEPVKEKEYGIEDCRTALSNLFDAKGREVAKSVLTEFKVARIGELKAEQYAAFVERCEATGKPE